MCDNSRKIEKNRPLEHNKMPQSPTHIWSFIHEKGTTVGNGERMVCQYDIESIE